MSYVELIGTIFTLWSVWLIAKRNILTWPVGIISVLLYLTLFYQIRLYSDALEQVYYLVISIYGWWRWNVSDIDRDKELKVRYITPRLWWISLLITSILSLALGKLMSNIHQILPAFFPEKASFPYLDAATTIMSFTAMALMTQKYLQSWYYWIVVDVIGIGLYYAKGVKFVALLYGILLIMAINGLLSWSRAIESNIKN